MLYIQHVSKMVRQTSGVSLAHQNREKYRRIMWSQTVSFGGTDEQHVLTHVHPSGCYAWEHLQTSSVFSCS
jgi:hypothetical protein